MFPGKRLCPVSPFLLMIFIKYFFILKAVLWNFFHERTENSLSSGEIHLEEWESAANEHACVLPGNTLMISPSQTGAFWFVEHISHGEQLKSNDKVGAIATREVSCRKPHWIRNCWSLICLVPLPSTPSQLCHCHFQISSQHCETLNLHCLHHLGSPKATQRGPHGTWIHPCP